MLRETIKGCESGANMAQSVSEKNELNNKPHINQYFNGPPCTIRTCDLPLRRGTLYPAELRAEVVLAEFSGFYLQSNLVISSK